MSVTHGKNSDTGMSSLKFDSTGRTVEFTPEESKDFETFLRGIKMQGQMSKESIASRGVYALKDLGDAIANGDLDIINFIWNKTGSPIIREALLNGMVEEVPIDNPFDLFYINDKDASKANKRKAILVSKTVKTILDNMIDALVNAVIYAQFKKDDTCCDGIINPFVQNIKNRYGDKVGLSDTASKEAILEYLKKKLSALGDLNAHNLAVYIYHKL